MKLIFAFSHYEDWNEVWQGDQAQGRKGLVSNSSLALHLALSSPPMRGSEIHMKRFH